MVHLEMSYLTHSKFFITMIPDILSLFRVRFRIFWWTCNSNSLLLEIRGNQKFWYSFPFPHEVWNSSWISALTLFRTRFRVPDDLVTSSVFRTRFEVMFPSSSARDFGFRWIDALSLFHLRFRVLDDPITSLFFRMRFEVIFFFSFTRGLEWFCSSSAWGSKMILIKWYFYSFPHEVLTFCWRTILLPFFARSLKLIFKW